MSRGYPLRQLAALSAAVVLAGFASPPASAAGNAGIQLHKTVDPAQVTINPNIGVTLAVSQATAIPGDTLTYTAVVSNPTATFAMGGDINAEAHANADATVAYYWDELEVCAQGCGNGIGNSHWTAVATFEATQPGYQPVETPQIHTGMSLAAQPVTRNGVVYPTSGDLILGTQISPSATAAWTYLARVTLTPAQIAKLSDPAQVQAMRNVIHMEVTVRNTTAAQPWTDPELFTNPFTTAPNPGAITNVTVTFTLPDGTTMQVPVTSSLAPGASATATAKYRVPVPAARGAGETEAAYVARLHALDGSALTATALAAGSGFSGTVYATSAPVTTNEFVPIVVIAKSGPSSIDAGDTETNPLALQNVGGATASALAITDTVPSSPNGSVSGTPASLAPNATGNASATYPVPVSQAEGSLTDTASVTWQDANGNSYGPLSSSFTTTVHNVLFGADLSLAPVSAGPNPTGSTQTLTASLVDRHTNPIPNQSVTFTITGANPGTGTATTDASGKAVFTYTGNHPGNDTAIATVVAPFITLTSNTASISWGKPLQPVVTTQVQGNFFPNPNNACEFSASGTPAFSQSFPDILFNADPSVIPNDISSINPMTRPFTDKTVDVNGNYNGQIVAQGNGFQAGANNSPLFNFFAAFTGSFIVNQAGDVTFTIIHDDGYILGVGNGATRVNGDLEGNVPTTTAFNGYGVVAGFNLIGSKTGSATVHFPAPGTYPYEIDYTECAGSGLQLVFETAKFIAQTDPLSIYVGYADGLRAGGSIFPFPWQGSPGVSFVGGCTFDAGAIRFDNSGDTDITFDHVTVDLGNGGPHFDLWPANLVVPAHGILILTQTGCFNFDTSDYSGAPCGQSNGVLPLVNVTRGGVLKTYTDTGQVLNTHGYDFVCQGNESIPWQRIAGQANTINVPLPPAVMLDLMPFNIPNAVQGQTVSVTVSALDGAGNPQVNLPVTLQAFGVNAQNLTANTNTSGLATFSYPGNFSGTDTLQASAFISGQRALSNQGTVVWSPPGGTNNPLGATITNTSPADGSVVTKPIPVDATIAPPAGHTIVSWRVFYQAAAGGPVVQIGGASGAPPSPLGVSFDPTVLANGVYTVTIEATTDNGVIQTINSGVSVFGGLKLGRYTTTVQDMTAAVSGYQMEVRRTYDSIDTTNGDFGIGWRIEVSNFRVSSNRVLGAGGWVQYNKSCVLGLCFTAFKNSGPRSVTVVFPDQHTEIFDFTPDGGTNIFWSCTPKFTARSAVGTTSTLVPLDDTGCTYQGDGNLYGHNGLYNPQRFQLTTKVGQVIELDRKLGLISTTDPDGNRLTVDASGVRASSGQSITFTRDSSGRITDITGPVANQHLHYDYFASPGPNELQSITNPNGHAFTYSYTASGLLTSEVGPDGKPIVTIHYDPTGRASSLAYGNQPAMAVHNDVAGQQQTIIDANNGLTTIDTFDDLGDVVQRDQIFGGTTRTTKYGYDAVGHRTLLLDNGQRSWKWTYDDVGNLTSFTDGAQRTWLFQGYNSLGEVGTVLQPDGTPMVTQTYDAQGHALTKQLVGQAPTTYAYWPSGAVKSVTDPGGRMVIFAYDSGGHLTSRTDALGRAIVYTPDAAGHVTAVLDPAGNSSSVVYDGLGDIASVTDGNHHTWTYFRDSYERLQRVQDPLGNSVNYFYDDVGRLQKIVDRNGATTTFAYDVDGRRIQESRPNNDNVFFTYDALGQMTSASDASAHDDFTYDGVGNLASQTSCGPTATPTTPCAAGASQPLVPLSYGYNASNQLASISGPDGAASYTYDIRGRLNQVTDPSHRNFGLTFDARDQLAGLTRPNGVSDTFTLNASGDLLSRNANLGQTAVSVAQYSPDPATGRTQQMTDADGTHTYTYQADGQLLTATHPASSGLPVESYSYDAAGNRTAWAGSSAASVSYDAADRLLSDGVNTYTYDLEGNLTAKTPRANPSSRTTYDWNTDHQLLAIHYPDGTTSTYAYDPLGRRVQAARAGSTTRYVWDLNGNLHSEYDGSNQLVASYVQSLAQDKPLEVTEGGASYYYVADGAGNIRALTDQNGAVVDSYRYDSFGNQVAAGNVHNPFSYGAREFDATSGLYYNRARYYDPSTGRFISEDPLSNASPYIYAGNNPVSLHDPSGMAGDYAIIINIDETAAGPIIVQEQVELTYTVGVAAPLVVGEVSVAAEEFLLYTILYGPLLFRLVALVVAFALLAKEACDFAHSADLPPQPAVTCPSTPQPPPPQAAPCGLDLPDPGGDGTKPVVGPGK